MVALPCHSGLSGKLHSLCSLSATVATSEMTVAFSLSGFTPFSTQSITLASTFCGKGPFGCAELTAQSPAPGTRKRR